MKKFLTIVFLISLFIAFVQISEKRIFAQEEEEKVIYDGGIKINLTAEETWEAIYWGAKNKDSYSNIYLPYKFGGDWTAYEEKGTIGTKFFLLAFIGYKSAKEHKTPEKVSIEAILSEESLRITIETYGDKPDFAKDYRVVLRQHGKVIKPWFVYKPDWAGITNLLPESPPYKALVQAFFFYPGRVGWGQESIIDPKAKTIIILIKDRDESRFEVDFSRCK